MAGAIGGLAVAAGVLAAIKDRLGLSWPATVLLTAGALVVLGYGAWRAKAALTRWWVSKPAAESSTAAGNPSPHGPSSSLHAADGGATETESAHPLTVVLSRAGAIGREQIIRAADVRTDPVPGVGIVHDIELPGACTYDDVVKRLGPIASMLGVTRLHLKPERNRQSERRVRLLVLDEPPFSRPFPAPGRREIEAFAGVPLGHDVTGQLAGVPSFNKASLLVGGMTQMGKTTLINGLITCLLIGYEEFELYLLDGKLCGLTKFEKTAVRYEASDDPAVMESMLDDLNGRAESRYVRIQESVRSRKPVPTFKPVFFIVDEAADFFADDGSKVSREMARRVEEKARTLVARSLESLIHVIMMTQRPANDAIPVKVRDQFVYRLCLYVASEGSAKVALGDSYFKTVAPIHPALLDPDIKGQAVLFANGTSTLLRGFNFADQFIWNVVDDVFDRRQELLSKAPATPLIQAIELMRSQSVDFMLTADLAAALGVSGQNPTDTGKRLNKLLGVPSYRGAKGIRGYRLSDLASAAVSGD
ncbi:FtsK/SpoIIIE domain-containing protein [Streptomyces sp. NPDC058579]|uniref:FtsK/SpoIIIE domain-containing protein n=1 Tax=Streptomyces sp. NPDC058579 TaxID=3346548 RepID=UPI0036499AB7